MKTAKWAGTVSLAGANGDTGHFFAKGKYGSGFDTNSDHRRDPGGFSE